MASGRHKAMIHQLTAAPTMIRRHHTHGSTLTWDQKPLSRLSWLSTERIYHGMLIELSAQTYMSATTVCLMKTLPAAPILKLPASTHAVERLAGISEFTKMIKIFLTYRRSELTHTQRTHIRSTNTWHHPKGLIAQKIATSLFGKSHWYPATVECH